MDFAEWTLRMEEAKAKQGRPESWDDLDRRVRAIEEALGLSRGAASTRASPADGESLRDDPPPPTQDSKERM